MAVERLTDYTRRIWTALGPDDPAGHDIHVNDVIYYMDSSECCIVTNVYPDGTIDCETLPDIGGGGSAGINLRLLGSGRYTQLSNTQRSVTIPTDLLPADVKVLYKVTSVNQTPPSSTQRMAAWYRVYHVDDYLDPEFFPSPSEAMTIASNGTKYWVARANGNINMLIWATADPGIGFNVVSNSYMTYAGDYDWEVWGY